MKMDEIENEIHVQEEEIHDLRFNKKKKAENDFNYEERMK